MRRIDSSQLAATLANIGVIIGLVFLVLEIQQANKIATATTEIEIRSLFSELNEALYAVPKFSELLVKAQDRDAELTAQEKEYDVDDDFIQDDTILVTEGNINIMLNDTKHAFGHGYCLCMALLGKAEEWC